MEIYCDQLNNIQKSQNCINHEINREWLSDTTMKPYDSFLYDARINLNSTNNNNNNKKHQKVPEYLLVVQLWKIININVSEMTTNFTLKKKLNKDETKGI